MAKFADYPKVETLTPTNLFLIDGEDGTRGIYASHLARAISEMIGGNGGGLNFDDLTLVSTATNTNEFIVKNDESVNKITLSDLGTSISSFINAANLNVSKVKTSGTTESILFNRTLVPVLLKSEDGASMELRQLSWSEFANGINHKQTLDDIAYRYGIYVNYSDVYNASKSKYMSRVTLQKKNYKSLSPTGSSGYYDHINKGDFFNWNVGSIIEIDDGSDIPNRYLVVDLDYWYYRGKPKCYTHHAVLMPLSLDLSGYFGGILMNGYVGSKFYEKMTTFESTIKADFGEEHLLTHYSYLTKEVQTTSLGSGSVEMGYNTYKYDWYPRIADIPSASMIFGGMFGHEVESDWRQLAYFALNNDTDFFSNIQGTSSLPITMATRTITDYGTLPALDQYGRRIELGLGVSTYLFPVFGIKAA